MSSVTILPESPSCMTKVCVPDGETKYSASKVSSFPKSSEATETVTVWSFESAFVTLTSSVIVMLASTASGMLVNVTDVALVPIVPPQAGVSSPLVKCTGLSVA